MAGTKRARKGVRIPMRIYKIRPATVAKLANTNVDLGVSEEEFLTNLTVEDIVVDNFGKNGIFVTSENVPNFVSNSIELASMLPNTFEVYEDFLGRSYILFQENRLFIRQGTSQAVLEKESLRIFEFYVNPTRVTPNFQKLITEMRTRGGWEIQHWGEALTDISVEGTSGAMIKKIVNGRSVLLETGDTVEESIAWKALTELSEIYKRDHLVKNQQTDYLLGFNMYDFFFIGYFTKFTGPIPDANSPYSVNYSFSFKAQETIRLSSKTLLSDYFKNLEG